MVRYAVLAAKMLTLVIHFAPMAPHTSYVCDDEESDVVQGPCSSVGANVGMGLSGAWPPFYNSPEEHVAGKEAVTA